VRFEKYPGDWSALELNMRHFSFGSERLEVVTSDCKDEDVALVVSKESNALSPISEEIHVLVRA